MIRFRIVACLCLLLGVSFGQQKNTPFQPEIPRTWNEKDLSEWATPVAGLNLRPGHFTEDEYYRAPLDNYRTYPVYAAGREPEGYWEMLKQVGPKPLFARANLNTKEDWVEAGKRVFEQYDLITLRSYDPDVIARVRSPEAARNNPAVSIDGTIGNLRWIPTEKGIAVGIVNCGSCHTRLAPDGKRIPGLPPTPVPPGSRPAVAGDFGLLASDEHIASAPLRIPESIGQRAYRAFGVPWIADDIHAPLKNMSPEEYRPLRLSALAINGIFARWNGSIFYPTKIPDLIGIQDRKYFDHTATHRHRDIGDLMRYAALVAFAETSDFGPYHMLTDAQRRIEGRLPDEALFALALYLYSLEPPPNPNPFDENAAAGQKIFSRESCANCHIPGLYTNNKLTLARGFQPGPGQPANSDVLPLSVGTDPGLALKTRKGTGYYKVPSLRGVWYRRRLLHDGSIASLEEMFDPDRLKETHLPGGWNPPGVTTRAVVGHEFGLKLTSDEKKWLLAFLRTL